MPISVFDLLAGVFMPIIVAALTVLLMRRALPSDLGNRYPASIALAGGFLVGYWLTSLGPWTPTAHWHWLPYLVATAAFIGPIGIAAGVRWFERSLLYFFLAAVAGWLLVPTWDDLAPARMIQVILFTTYVALLASLLEELFRRAPGPTLSLLLAVTSIVAAVVLILSDSLRFMQIMLAATSACFGIALVSRVKQDGSVMTGTALAFSLLAVGMLYIGWVNSFSEVPFVSYALIPAVPLLHWIGTIAPLPSNKRIRRLLFVVSLELIALGLAVAMAVLATQPEQNGG